MNRKFLAIAALASFLGGSLPLMAQTSSAGTKPDATQTPAKSGEANPFPEDTSAVPVMPTNLNPAPDASSASDNGESVPAKSSSHLRFTGGEDYPVRSPDDASLHESTSDDESSYSSSRKGLGSLLPDPDTDRLDKHHPKQPPPHVETAREDISVGGYYLEKKNWKAAQSRFQSAMVLDPENPEVFWGLAEAAYHLGDMAHARDYYQKLLDYDPDGPHGKQARKALKDSALAHAVATPAGK